MDTKSALDQIIEIFNTGNTAQVESLFSSNYIDHQRPNFITVDGPEEFKQIVQLARKSLTTLTVTIEETTIDEDKLIARLHWTSIDLQGKKKERETIDTLRFVNGQIIEHWGEEIFNSDKK